jgi:hypothetical protein
MELTISKAEYRNFVTARTMVDNKLPITFVHPLARHWQLDILKNMILLVEDELISRCAFGRLLRSVGHDVIEARDGTEALALLNHWRVERHDAIVLKPIL